MIRNKHKAALENESKRKEDEKRKKIEELKRQRDEKIRRRIERQRRKHEKEMEELRQQIKDELISKGEYIDNCTEIYNMNFYGQKEFRGRMIFLSAVSTWISVSFGTMKVMSLSCFLIWDIMIF